MHTNRKCQHKRDARVEYAAVSGREAIATGVTAFCRWRSGGARSLPGIVGFLLLATVVGATEWQVQAPYPVCTRILDGQSLGNGLIVTAGRAGDMLVSRDSGNTWECRSTPTATDLWALYAADTSYLWVCGGVMGFGYLAWTSDGGQSWTEPAVPGPVDLIYRDVSMAEDGTVWITNEDTVRNLYSSRDTGRTWTDRSIAGHRLHLVEMLGEGFGVAGGTVGSSITSAVFLTYNGGQTWTPAAQFPDSVGIVQMAVRPADSTVYIGGTCGIARSDDLGATWRTVMHQRERQILRGLCFQGPDSGIVFMWHSAGGERVFVTHDGGTTWSDNQLPVCHEVDDYVPLKGVEAGILLANPIAIFRYQSDSGTVTELSDNTGNEMLSIDFYDGNAGCAARGASLCTFEPTEAYWTSDGGDHWEPSSCPVGNPTRVMCFGDGVAVINGAQRTEDRGATWEATGIPETYLCGKIPGTAAGVYAATDSGLFVSYDAGAHWSSRALPYSPPSDLQDLSFADSLVAYAVGEAEPYMKRSVDGGRTWSNVACDLGACNPRRILGIAFADSLHGWLFGGSLDWPMICRTNDGGKTWESATFDTVWSAAFPLDFYRCTVRQLVAADAANAWAVARHNHVFTTNDSGKHWHEVRVDHCPRALYDIACRPESGIWVCGNNNAILHVPWAPASVLPDGLGRHTGAGSPQEAGVMPRLFDLRGRLVTTPSGPRTSSPMLYIWSRSHGAAAKPVLQLPRTTNLPGLEN